MNDCGTTGTTDTTGTTVELLGPEVVERGKMESNRSVGSTVVFSRFDFPCSITPKAVPGDWR